MPIEPTSEASRNVAGWLLTSAGVALVMSFLRDVIDQSEDGWLVRLARAGVNALFSLGVGAIVLRVATVTVYELLIIVGILGYLGSDYAFALIRRWMSQGEKPRAGL